MESIASESILNSIKTMLGSAGEYDGFDIDIVFNINASFAALRQLGVGPVDGFFIRDDTSIWSDFLSEDDSNLYFAKMYVYANAKLRFDPPASVAAIDILKEQKKEYEFRMTVDNDI